MPQRLALYLLGTPQLYLDNASISTARRKARALLAYLAIERGQHRRESLSTLLWPDYDQSKAFTNLRHTLWEIQQSIGEGWLIANRDRLGWNEDVDTWLDVRQFESMLAESQAQSDIPLRIPLLLESINLYRNHFMTGFSLKDAPTFNEWMIARAEDLRCQLAGALINLSDDYCAIGQAEKAIPYARRLITLDPLNESAQRGLMKVYWHAGQHSAALKQYQNFEEFLRKELNLNPQSETYALYKQIRKGESKPAPIDKPKETVASKPDFPSPTSISPDRKKEQIVVRDKPGHDLTADLYLPDAYIRWMLLTAEDTIGKLGLRVVLRKAGLDHLIGNYPIYEQPRPSKRFTFGDYAALNTELINFFEHQGETQLLSMGRLAIKHSVTDQGALYGIGTVTLPKFASLSAQLKVSMEVIVEAVRRASQFIGQEHRLSLEDQGDKLVYSVQDCIFCAGKESNQPMCMYLTGNLQGALHWLTGEEFRIEEVECRAMGAKACVWEIHKQPKQHD